MVAKPGKKQKSIRSSNVLEILKILRSGGKTFSQLEEAMGLSNAAIFKIVKSMAEKNLIIKKQMPSITIGRKAELIEINDNYGFFSVINISDDIVVSAINNFFGETISVNTYKVGYFLTKNAIEKVFADLRSCNREISHVVMVYSGKYDSVNDKFVFARKYKNFYDLNFRHYLESLAGVPVILRNDMMISVLPELEYPVNPHSFIYIGIRKWTGGAIVLNKKVFFGEHGMAGEIGFFNMNPITASNIYPSKEYITFNDIFSFETFLKKYDDSYSKLDDHYEEKRDYFIQQYLNNDEKAVEIIKTTAHILARFIWSISELLNICNLIIDGDVKELGDSFIKYIREALTSLQTHSAILVKYSEFNNDNLLKGGSIEGLNYFDKKISKI